MPDIELIGFKTPLSIEPCGYVPFTENLLVVYGDNGAGKSMALEAFESALAGCSAPRAAIWGRNSVGEVSAAAVVRSALGGIVPLRDTVSDCQAEDYSTVDTLTAALGELRHSRLERKAHPLDSPWSDLVDEIADANYAFLVPTGNAQARWVAFPSTSPSSLAAERWHAAVHSYVEQCNSRLEQPLAEDLAFDKFWHETDACSTAYQYVSDLLGMEWSVGLYRTKGISLSIEETPFPNVVLDGKVRVAAEVSRVFDAVAHSMWLRDGRTADAPEHVASHFDGYLDAIKKVATAWESSANNLLAKLMLSPPEVKFDTGGPRDWFSKKRPRWVVSPGDQIDNLSSAETRWVSIAIALASPINDKWEWSAAGELVISRDGADASRNAPIVVIDEPERGLHRAAERHMAAGLLELARSGRVRAIIATHSPELLDAGVGRMIHLEKNATGGIGKASWLGSREVQEAKAVGAGPSLLLEKDRGFLLVEGAHDQAILEGWFAEDLERLRVGVLAMHGTQNLINIFDSEFLVRRSNALLMPLLDDVALDPLFQVWAAAEAKLIDGRRNDAVRVISSGLDRVPGGGAKVYGSLLISSVVNGTSERFFPLGMSKKDVLEYLPVGDVVKDATSWDALWKEWSRSPAAVKARKDGQGVGKAYKTWLRRSKNADLSEENLRLVAETTQPHPELKAMIAKIGERLDRPQPTSAEL